MSNNVSLRIFIRPESMGYVTGLSADEINEISNHERKHVGLYSRNQSNLRQP